MRLVTADGTLHTVSAFSPEAGLWWAVEGAGHNFGIVISVTSKIYDVTVVFFDPTRALFSPMTKSRVSDHIKKFSANQPVDLVHLSTFLRNPDGDPENPIIVFFIFQEGVSAIESTYAALLRDLGPVRRLSSSGTYKDIPGRAGFFKPSEERREPSQRDAFDFFSKGTSEIPQLNSAIFLLEGDSSGGDPMLVSLVAAYTEPALEEKAVAFGESLRQICSERADRRNCMHMSTLRRGSESQRFGILVFKKFM
ncbi:uncharacterized protein ATNIH1004_004090 [Aspergillus tanneri]|uniref:FAD-binding PCMH-type domain-containing protein n=1 Tax=Aspergillus tanneri TaxID=1220188 RepID=A0A5M9N0N6_9EURO|nr:uncharacterized protein ATNIH1004_004090 [Aspergillus tanneri]KAA8648207.1 hypothetical protein ATNIH1004_004090 [Aspergillus tanneri]